MRAADKAACAVAIRRAGRAELHGAVLCAGAPALPRAAGLPQPRPRALPAARALARLRPGHLPVLSCLACSQARPASSTPFACWLECSGPPVTRSLTCPLLSCTSPGQTSKLDTPLACWMECSGPLAIRSFARLVSACLIFRPDQQSWTKRPLAGGFGRLGSGQLRVLTLLVNLPASLAS